MVQFPPYGYRFNPTDEEIIQMLQHKASGREIPLAFLLQKDVYKQDPQELQWEETQLGVRKYERYYHYKKKNESREVSGLGWWKATSHVKKIYANDQHTILGYKRPLAFHRFNNKDRNRYNAVKTNYIMHEYSLHGSTRPTDWRLCKMKYKGKPSSRGEMEKIIHGQRYNSLLSSISDHQDDQASGSDATHQDLVGDGEQEQQERKEISYLVDSTVVPRENNEMQFHEVQQQQASNLLYDSSYNLPPYHDSTSGYYFDAHEELFDSAPQSPFPALWSWQL